MVFGLGHAAQQRPDDARDVTGSDAEPGVSIDDAGRFSRDRNVGENSDDEPSPDRRSIDGRDDHLVAIDDVVDEVLGFLPRGHALIGSSSILPTRLKSPPAENALPAPVTMTARTEGSASISLQMCVICVCVSASTELKLSGRLKVIFRMPSGGSVDLQLVVGFVAIAHGVAPSCGLLGLHGTHACTHAKFGLRRAWKAGKAFGQCRGRGYDGRRRRPRAAWRAAARAINPRAQAVSSLPSPGGCAQSASLHRPLRCPAVASRR